MKHVKLHFDPSSVQHAATTNEGAAAITYISEVQPALIIQKHKPSSHAQ